MQDCCEPMAELTGRLLQMLADAGCRDWSIASYGLRFNGLGESTRGSFGRESPWPLFCSHAGSLQNQTAKAKNWVITYNPKGPKDLIIIYLVTWVTDSSYVG